MVSVYAEKAGNVWFGVAFEAERIFVTAFGSSEKNVLQSLEQSLGQDIRSQRLEKASKFAERVIAVMKDIYDGKDVSHKFSFETERLTNYARRVIEAVCLIPPGYVTSYGEIAHSVGGSPRAVGRVMATNPFAPLCPCHRIVRSDFTLGGYGGGLDVKLAFLKRERKGYSSEEVVDVGSGKLEMFPVESLLQRLDMSKR
jgi:methylated-DNA-[protein]-cysteine S-methyltransferase